MSFRKENMTLSKYSHFRQRRSHLNWSSSDATLERRKIGRSCRQKLWRNIGATDLITARTVICFSDAVYSAPINMMYVTLITTLQITVWFDIVYRVDNYSNTRLHNVWPRTSMIDTNSRFHTWPISLSPICSGCHVKRSNRRFVPSGAHGREISHTTRRKKCQRSVAE